LDAFLEVANGLVKVVRIKDDEYRVSGDDFPAFFATMARRLSETSEVGRVGDKSVRVDLF